MTTFERRGRSRLLFLGAGALAATTGLACGHGNDTGGRGAPSGPGTTTGITINEAAHDAQFASPFDATPDPEGTHVFFTALTKDGPAVFRSERGGGGLTRLFAGEPLVSPFSIAISDDGRDLFIADAAAETSEADERGAVFRMSVSGTGGGGTPAVVAGTSGTTPRGIEVRGAEVYFSGSQEGVPAVFAMPLAGGPSAILTGAPLRDPGGIAVAASGAVYVVDGAGAASQSANVLKIEGGGAAIVATDIRVGFPAGLALGANDATLLVSALDGETARDRVLVIDLASLATTSFDETIHPFSDPAGLHRARRAPVFAWADSQAQGTGTVYVLQ